VVAGLQFTNPNLIFTGKGQFARVTRCKISDIGRASIQMAAYDGLRVDHCDVSGYRSTTFQKHFVLLGHREIGSGDLKNVLVDHNWCHSISPSVGTGASELIGLTASTAGAAGAFPGIWIEYNRFDNINLTAEGELVGAKTSGIVFAGNTVIGGGTLYLNLLRQGQQGQCLENWFEDVPTNFVRVFSFRCRVIGNRFVGNGRILVCPGNFTFAGTNEPGYAHTQECQIISNIMGAPGTVRIGDTRASTSPLPALDNNVFGNSVTGGGDPISFIPGKHVGTTFDNPGISWTPAVRLELSQVGPLAPLKS